MCTYNLSFPNKRFFLLTYEIYWIYWSQHKERERLWWCLEKVTPKTDIGYLSHWNYPTTTHTRRRWRIYVRMIWSHFFPQPSWYGPVQASSSSQLLDLLLLCKLYTIKLGQIYHLLVKTLYQVSLSIKYFKVIYMIWFSATE